MNYVKQRITVYLPEGMVFETDEIAYRAGLTRNALITMAVKSLIQQKQIVINTEVQKDNKS